MSNASLILVTIDCLRADHVGWLGYGRPTTPFLDLIAPESTIFWNATIAGAPTYYSFPAIMASRHPLALGRDIIGLAPAETTIATVLKKAGYATAAFVAGNPYLSSRFGYDAGFDVFSDFSEDSFSRPVQNSKGTKAGALSGLNRRLAGLCDKAGWSRAVYNELYFQYCQRTASPADSLENQRPFPTADVLVAQAANWLEDKTNKPFFLWLHLMDAHSPYYPTENAWKAMGHAGFNPTRIRYLNACWNRSDLSVERLRKYRADVVNLYDAGIRWVDMQLALLIEKLRELGLWENSVFALTADHGEEFLERGRRYHSPAQLGEEVVRVPLLIRRGDMPIHAVAKDPFSMLHLAPSLLDSVGAEIPASFRGASVWRQAKDKEPFDDVAIVEVIPECTNPVRRENRMRPRAIVVRGLKYKLVLNFGAATAELFDLQRDPGERAPLAADAEKAIRSRLLKKAFEHVNRSITERDARMTLMGQLRELRLECAQSSA